ncbi:GTPase-activating protein and VPS9 domain-containing protein 1-like isoform X3 [Dendroctonus ponderosae]|uniref:GTPase-activating protein and VPS9 domain-containing protein 1-like isoform X3 n=1 Tax=Dendroctonus ponderosae TaxID=77166 RepID=UPI0020353FD1|nr:GTPase-activating protein and VPS9 domain-containing protein 1-like isoform X3 [Dendroctonus ponderosae]
MKNETLDDDSDIYTFICKLRQEKLFIKSEKLDIQELNELIRAKTQTVIKASWLTNKQKLLLFERRVSSQNCRRFDFVRNSEFVEAKNTLGFQNSVKISNLLHILRSQPKQLANWLITGEAVKDDAVQHPLLLQSLLNGLYGGCVFADDTKLLLTLLFELAKKQLLKSDNPRRIIKQRSCSFRHLYFLFHEIYQPAKFFLSAALEMPILELLSFSDYFLDIDHDKTIMRFRQDENLKVYKDAVEYRNDVASKLAQFTNSFVQSLLENVCSFPRALAWIAFHIYKMIENNYCAKEANSIITELLFTLFICPVIVDPEQYGIANAVTSEMVRHNLIQVGKIMQILALYKFEGIDKKYLDIFENVDKNSMSNFVELLFFDMDSSDPPVDTSPEVVRDIMLFTEEELNNLVYFLQKVQMIRVQNDNFEKNPSLSVSIEEHLSSLAISRENSPQTSRPNGDLSEFSPAKKPPFFSLGSLGTQKAGQSTNRRSPDSEEKSAKNFVIVFPIDGVSTEPVGLLPEDKVIDLSVPLKSDSGVFVAVSDMELGKENILDTNGTSNSNDLKDGYSGYADEGSIGNTSDNLEAISEAASNHSVASSLELENEDQNDNLSDMVSANVSGRGTPNISGRDTPSSQVNENDDRPHTDNQRAEDHVDAGAQPQQQQQQPPNISRQRRSEIDDKFCKFEIKRLLEGDETVSIISETWSTDVLASDNETIGESESRLERQQHLHLVDQAIQEVDISETQSESAWSTDVMASDTERLIDVDNDDTASVAQSDDTNSVARSDDTRSETDEVASARRLSSCSGSYGGILMNTSTACTNFVTVSVNSPSYVPAGNNVLVSQSSATGINVKSLRDSNFVTINQNYVSSASFQEFKKRDGRLNGKINTEVDRNANNVFKPIAQHGVAQSTQTTVSFSSVTTNSVGGAANKQGNQKSADNNQMPGPSGFNGKDFEGEPSIKNSIMKKYGDRPTEILLSNCSLNSSSSGSSSNSFENNKVSSTNDNSEQWEPKPWLTSSGSSLNVTLTPSESTSELSVLSVNSHLTASVVNPAVRKTTMVLNRSLKPSASTGAIPKSISFDMSVNKGLDDDSSRSKRGGFFGRLRKGFGYKKRSFRNQEDLRNGDEDFLVKQAIGDSPIRLNNSASDSSDDILAKYRKPSAESSPVKENGHSKKSSKVLKSDNLNQEANSFTDVKKKLRLVLGNTSEIPYFIKNPCSMKIKLETILRLEMGKARKLREWSSAARIAEALRCVQLLDERHCLKLIQSLRADLRLRATYLRYLVSSKQELLFTEMYLNTLQDQIKHDRIQCEFYFASVCVREFLSEQEPLVMAFCDEFRRLSLADEKCDFLQNFYLRLFEIMNENKHWQDVLHKRDFLVKVTLERCIMSRVYFNAIYPNGDGDRDRDRVLHEHIGTLSKSLRPEHKDLLIPSAFLRESPWLPAQEALRALDAARTPRDKLRCVSRCAKCLVDLLGLSGSCAAADDFTPVLVYVIIKVNPVALLSTVQFVNSFNAGQIRGEDEYWWTQFCSAVEYIKTMDYSD